MGRGGGVVTRRSAKPQLEGSIPSRASNSPERLDLRLSRSLILTRAIDPAMPVASLLEWLRDSNGSGPNLAMLK